MRVCNFEGRDQALTDASTKSTGLRGMQYGRKSTSSAGHSASKYGVGAGISSASVHGGSSIRGRQSGSAEFEVRTATVPSRKKASQGAGRRSKDTQREEAESTEDAEEYEFIRAPSPSGASSQLVPVSPPCPMRSSSS